MTTDIRPKAVCIFRNDDKILVSEYTNFETDEPFYRPLGGSIEFGENSELALKREIKEELGADITNVRLLGVVENIYNYKDKLSHEIMFVYDGEFVDASYYDKTEFLAYEATSDRKFKVMWKSLDDFELEDDVLYPRGIEDLIAKEISLDFQSPTIMKEATVIKN